MKKLTLSISTISLFFIYGLFEQFFMNKNKPIIQPVNPTPNPSPASQIETNQNSNPLSALFNTPTPTQITGNTGTDQSGYKDGTFTGPITDAYYGNVQVRATIQNGKITNVQFLQYPNDRRTSIMINSQAMPILQQEAIQAQNANVDIVSGATDTSRAFIESLTQALSKANSI